MEIRKATEADIDEVSEIGNQIEEFRVSSESILFWPKEVLRDCVSSNENIFLVAKVEGKIVGFLISNYNPMFRKAIIENLAVKEEYRGRGIGDELCKFALEELRKIGCKYVCHLIKSDNDIAIEFSSKAGFKKGIECVWMSRVIDDSFRHRD